MRYAPRAPRPWRDPLLLSALLEEVRRTGLARVCMAPQGSRSSAPVRHRLAQALLAQFTAGRPGAGHSARDPGRRRVPEAAAQWARELDPAVASRFRRCAGSRQECCGRRALTFTQPMIAQAARTWCRRSRERSCAGAPPACRVTPAPPVGLVAPRHHSRPPCSAPRWPPALQGSLGAEHHRSVAELVEAAWQRRAPLLRAETSALLGGALLFVDELERGLESAAGRPPRRTAIPSAEIPGIAPAPPPVEPVPPGTIADAATVLDSHANSRACSRRAISAAPPAANLQLGRLTDAEAELLAALRAERRRGRRAADAVRYPSPAPARLSSAAMLFDADWRQVGAAGRRSGTYSRASVPSRSTAARRPPRAGRPARARPLAEHELEPGSAARRAARHDQGSAHASA